VSQRVAEHVVRVGLLRRRRRLRVDLHGVSVFGPGGAHTLIRWEWVESVTVEGPGGGVVVRSAKGDDEVRFPAGAFGCDPATLVGHLEAAQSIARRPEIIAALAGGA
jgi:hypothetical protein